MPQIEGFVTFTILEEMENERKPQNRVSYDSGILLCGSKGHLVLLC